jgi:hypothetical protein
MPMGNEAGADGARRVYSKKKCIAPKTRFSAQSTWVCAVAEKCCYDRLMRKGACIKASDRCF